MSLKSKLLIVAASVGGVLILMGLASWLFYRSFIAPIFALQEPPPELQEAKVILGADFLARSDFYQAGNQGSWLDFRNPDKLKSKLDSIEDLRVGELDGQPGLDIGLVGKFGMTLLDTQGQLKERITYQFATEKFKVGPFEGEREKSSFYTMRAIDIEGDGICEILGYNGMDGAIVFDHQGRVILNRGESVEGKPSIQEITAGDVDGDGVVEFVAGWGYEPWKGIELFDRSGKSRWRLQEEFLPGPFEIVDYDGDGKIEIIEKEGMSLKIRDAQGNVINNPAMPVYLWHLSLCPRPGGEGPPQNLAVREGSSWLIDLDGKNFTRFDAPLSEIKLQKTRRSQLPGTDEFVIDTEQVFRAKGAWIKLKKDQPKFLAVIATFATIDRSLFYVYDQQSKLIYHEILPEDCNSIAVLESESGNGAEDVLVGGETTVWRYTAR